MQVSSHMVHFGGKADSVIFTNEVIMLLPAVLVIGPTVVQNLLYFLAVSKTITSTHRPLDSPRYR